MFLLWIFSPAALAGKKRMQFAFHACFLWCEEICVSWYLNDLLVKEITSSSPFLLYQSCRGG